jgi:hypothetical protein
MNQSVLNRSRNDKFTMILDLPLAMKNITDPVLQSIYSADPIQFSIYGSPVPSVTVPDISVPYGAQVHRISSNARPAYTPLSIKFLVDNGYKNYWILWNWLNLFNDTKTGSSDIASYPNNSINVKNPVSSYVSTFNIYALDEYNNKTISFNYSNAFPTTLSELNFSNQDPSEINCTVTFAFNQLDVKLLRDVNKISC